MKTPLNYNKHELETLRNVLTYGTQKVFGDCSTHCHDCLEKNVCTYVHALKREIDDKLSTIFVQETAMGKTFNIKDFTKIEDC